MEIFSPQILDFPFDLASIVAKKKFVVEIPASEETSCLSVGLNFDVFT